MSKNFGKKETNRQLKRVTDDGKSLRVKLVDENNADITTANPLDVSAELGSTSQTTLTNIETYTNTTWQALGKPTTTVADDGDLRTIDTDAESLSTDPTANTSGAATTKHSIAFLLRWIVKRLQGATPSGENHIGSIGGNTFTLAVTQTTNASAYEAGDAVGGKVTITNAMRVSGGTGVLQSIQVIDKGNQKAALEILIFDSDPSAATITDDTAFAYSTDITKQIARVSIAASDYVTIDSKATASIGGLSRIVQASGSTNLYAAVVTTGTPTYTSTSDIIVTFGILQD